MQKLLILGAAIILIVIIGYYADDDVATQTPTDATDTTAVDDVTTLPEGLSVTPISHATFVLEWDDLTIYNDPIGGAEAFAATGEPDLILVSDIHGDHLSVETLEGVVGQDTIIIAPQAVADEFSATLMSQTQVMANGDETSLRGLTIEALPMYNLPESEDAPHVKGRGNGYLLSQGDARVYIAGDTGDTPEMRALTDIDVAFVPMNLPYTMDVNAAADAVAEFAPAIVYPYHYRGQAGLSDVEAFRTLVNQANQNVAVVLADWYPEQE